MSKKRTMDIQFVEAAELCHSMSHLVHELTIEDTQSVGRRRFKNRFRCPEKKIRRNQ